MIRDLAWGVAGALAIVAFAAMVLFFMPGQAWPSEPCRGIVGEASWYGTESCTSHPCRTASGAAFTGRSLTAAMPDKSHIGERWRVSYAGRSVVVLIDDWGPARYLHRVADLSRAAAVQIGLIGPGHGVVCLERVG